MLCSTLNGLRKARWGCAVDAKDNDSKRFYEKFGFIPNDDVHGDPLALWLPLEQCIEAVVALAQDE